jgi:hypothetical protein
MEIGAWTWLASALCKTHEHWKMAKIGKQRRIDKGRRFKVFISMNLSTSFARFKSIFMFKLNMAFSGIRCRRELHLSIQTRELRYGHPHPKRWSTTALSRTAGLARSPGFLEPAKLLECASALGLFLASRQNPGVIE